MTEKDFLSAIIDEPDARAHSLVYADWLEEQGETVRARLIRIALGQEQLFWRHPRHSALAKEATKLQAKCKASWPAYKKWQKVFAMTWKRGLPTTATVNHERPVPLAELRKLPEFPWLTTLSTRVTPTPDFVAQFAERTSFQELQFEYGARPDDEAVRAVAQLPQVRRLSLVEGRITDAGLEHLRPLKELKALFLSSTSIGDDGADRLRSFPHLEELGLQQTQITDEGLKAVSGLSKLRALDLSYTQITDAGLKSLRKLSQLRSLDISSTQIKGDPLDTLVKFKHLRFLGLHELAGVNDDNVMRLAEFPELEELDLSRTSVTRYRLRRLLKLPKLKKIRMEASLAISGESVEMREVEAFLQDFQDSNVFIELDME
jgi:uncharacterized protein (TIGR02996 family)